MVLITPVAGHIDKQHAWHRWLAGMSLLLLFCCRYDTHPMLANIFVCITFGWDPTRLIELEANLAELHHYPSTLTVRVVTNQVQHLGRAMAGPFFWLQSRIQNLQVTGPEHELSDFSDLSHWHRGLMEEAFADLTSNYTLFLYLVSMWHPVCSFAFIPR